MVEEYFEEDPKSYLKQRKSSTAAFNLQYHIVFSTKSRKPVLVGEISTKLKSLLIEICIDKGYHLLGLSIVKDHIHIILSLKPTDRLSEVLRVLKGKSGLYLLKAFPHLKDAIGKNSLWTAGYSVDTLGKANVAQVKAYLDRQEGHHTMLPPDKSSGSWES